jgi:SAM-dependent methyltransferase
MSADPKLVEYYRRRAGEYEEIYEWRDPRRQEEQDLVSDAIKSSLGGRDVLEVACGTGYWTRVLSETAGSIVATDLGEEVMEVARGKEYGCPVTFRREDAYRLSFGDGAFDGGLAFSWFSHVPRAMIDPFLEEFHRVLKPGSRVFIVDNVYVEGIGGELVTREGDIDTYKIRTLRDGGVFTIVKNYFEVDDLHNIFGKHVRGFSEENVFHGKCFWYVDYVI